MEKKLYPVIRAVQENNALPVIPWGAGKWMGKRGEIVRRIMEDQKYYPVFMGDNGNRPFFWKKPAIFDEAKEKFNIANISGSDPLPFSGKKSK